MCNYLDKPVYPLAVKRGKVRFDVKNTDVVIGDLGKIPTTTRLPNTSIIARLRTATRTLAQMMVTMVKLPYITRVSYTKEAAPTFMWNGSIPAVILSLSNMHVQVAVGFIVPVSRLPLA